MKSLQLLASFIFLYILLFSCQQKPSSGDKEVKNDSISADSVPVKNFKQMAEELAQKTIIVDGHVDLAYRLLEHWEDVTQPTYFGNFDYPKAKQGGLNAPFISIYVPVAYENNGAKRHAFRQIEMIKKLADDHPDKFAIATNPDQIRSNFEQGLISFPMGMENGAPIEGDLHSVRIFYDLGIRYITLCHSKNNHICDASYDKKEKWHGLSPFGKKLVPEMNRIGMMIDISHLSDSSAYQVLRYSDKPVIASHSSCRRFTPGMERNMSDGMMKKLAENDGVLMISFGAFFLDSKYRKAYKDIEGWGNSQKMIMYDTAILTYAQHYNGSDDVFGTVAEVADHIDHAVEVMGIDHVGFGSDYDGIGWQLPPCLRYVSGYPCLIEELLKRGYTSEEIAKICYKNIFRVWKANTN